MEDWGWKTAQISVEGELEGWWLSEEWTMETQWKITSS